MINKDNLYTLLFLFLLLFTSCQNENEHSLKLVLLNWEVECSNNAVDIENIVNAKIYALNNSKDTVLINLSLDSTEQYEFFLCKSDTLFKIFSYNNNRSIKLLPNNSTYFNLTPFIYLVVPDKLKKEYKSNFIKRLLSYKLYYITETNDTILIEKSKGVKVVFDNDC